MQVLAPQYNNSIAIRGNLGVRAFHEKADPCQEFWVFPCKSFVLS